MKGIRTLLHPFYACGTVTRIAGIIVPFISGES